MRIVLIAEELGIGGLPNYVLTLAQLLGASGCEVLVAHGNAPLPRHLETGGLTLVHLPGLARQASLTLAFDAVRHLVAWAPNVVHIHLCTSLPIIDRLLASGLLLVRSFHDYTSLCLRLGRRRWRGDRCNRPLGWGCAAWGCLVSPPRAGARIPQTADLPAKISERNRYRDFGASIVASQYMAETLRINGFAPDRIHVVPHFSRFEQVATADVAPRKQGGAPGRDRPVELLFSGQAVDGKGLEILIAALNGVSGNWRLSVLSDGPRLAAARALAATYDLGDRIRFLGWATQEETRQHYEHADLLVVPSIWADPAPLVALEAMAFGTPAVGFAVGGIPDVLIDDVTGVLVHETTEGGLRAGLIRAMADPEKVLRWGTEARTRIAQAHTRDDHERGLRRAYAAAAMVHARGPGLIAGLAPTTATERASS